MINERYSRDTTLEPLNLHMDLPRQTDFLIIGAGIIGIAIALELKRRFPDCSIVLLEKEDQCGRHASGRNSGVLHAGFYYTADSLKAKLTRQGNHELTAYCLDHKIPINRCGKLVVARNEGELGTLQELVRRGRNNHVAIELLNDREAREIEPRVKTFAQALFSPSTATVNPADVMRALEHEAQAAGVQLITRTQYVRRAGDSARTNRGSLSAGYTINAAGLYADRIARQFGFAEQLTILPFKGLYLRVTDTQDALRCCVYPVPDMKNPFLGVHLTVTVDGRTTIGPTAMPAFWRENYQGLENFRMDELFQIIVTGMRLFIANNFGFRDLAIEELKKTSRRYLLACAGELASGISERSASHWGMAGIRAQLVNTRTRSLVMDFSYAGDDRSFHVLNAVSPAFTCALPFSRLMVDEIERLINQ